jgi:hypothetical protein
LNTSSCRSSLSQLRIESGRHSAGPAGAPGGTETPGGGSPPGGERPGAGRPGGSTGGGSPHGGGPL